MNNKGARLFKILQCQIGSIPKCVVIFQKKLPICIFGCPKLNISFHRGTFMFFLKLVLKSQSDFCKNFLRNEK